MAQNLERLDVLGLKIKQEILEMKSNEAQNPDSDSVSYGTELASESSGTLLAAAETADGVAGLLPCPFCGSTTAPRLAWDHLIAEDAWYVVCGTEGCGARSQVFGSYESDYCIKATAAWNRRADTRTSSQWQPIETAPRDTLILLLRKVGPMQSDSPVWVGRLCANPDVHYAWLVAKGEMALSEFVGWMPLPAKPETSEQKG